MIRAIDKWLPGYLGSVVRRREEASSMRHLLFCIADHFEPFRVSGAPPSPTGYGAAGECRVPDSEALARVERWVGKYQASVKGYEDADGRSPQHTFFYPQEEYDVECVNRIASLCTSGSGEIEVHLHHSNDTSEGLESKLVRFRDMLHEKHGALGTDAEGRVRFGFVHGNWALCNSRPDGDWCGVDEELSVLRHAGCYADFTFPSAPSPTQPRMVNSIYYAHDTPGRPRGHDHGRLVRSGGHARSRNDGSEHDGLMLIQGPLGLNWRRRKWGVFPRLENADISASNPPTPLRVDLWVSQQIQVVGRPEWVFVKVHTHGCVERNTDVCFGVDQAWRLHMHERYNDGVTWCLHYVTAREMYNIARAAEDGKTGNPDEYRDYDVGPPATP